MIRTFIAAALAFLVACAPETEAPVRVQALVLTGAGAYEPREVQLTTITDIVHMEGLVAKMVGGARIRYDSQDPLLQNATTLEGLGKALIKGEGRDVTASFITHDEVLWPADFHTWNLVSAYYNFERAFDYFNKSMNIPQAELVPEPTTVYYFPEFVLADLSSKPLKDNALFFSPVSSFMVLPFDELQRAPLAINSGIMAHEYAHLVFNKKVYGGHPLSEPLNSWSSGGSSPGANLLKALDEGLADYHGYGTTCKTGTGCDPRFLRTSFDEQLSDERDLSKSDRCVDFALSEQLKTANLNNFDEYKLGSIIASALYQAAQSTNSHEELQRALVSAYSDETAGNPGLRQLINLALTDQTKFNLISVSAVIINHVSRDDTPLKTAVCNELIDHLQIPAAELVGPDKPCPPAAQGGNTCPRIN